MYNDRFMAEAIIEANLGVIRRDGGPFGSVVVKDGKVVGRGHNEVLKNEDPTCHGEIQAIRDACNKLDTFDLSGCELYTTSEPCGMCLYACMWARIDKVYYGCTVEDAASIGFDDRQFDKITGLNRDNVKSFIIKINEGRDNCVKLFERYVKTNPQTY